MEESHRPMSGFDLLHIPYDERWEHLKPTMVDAYMGMNGFGEPLTFPKLADFMKKNHGFSAEIHQYRHRFKKWGIRKRTIREEKEGIVKTLGKRNRAGASTSDVTIYQGGLTKEVDKKQLKRFLNDEIRHQVAMPLFPGTFSQWNLPYAAYKASIAKPMDHPSPFGPSPAAPQYLHINSPEATTPGGTAPELTPTATLIRQKTLLDRSNLLLQGDRKELLIRCNNDDRRIVSGWLHDYWMHSFLTAKFWGRGPKRWTARMILDFTLGGIDFGSPQAISSPAGRIHAPSSHRSEIPQPTSLCRWVIHHCDDVDMEYVIEPSSPNETQAEFDFHDVSSWTPWPESETQAQTLQTVMEESFKHSRFSTTSVDDLPISNKLVTEAVSNSPEQLALDSCAFAIMSGNLESVDKLLRGGSPIDIGAIYPYHLAASFLDGGHTCCLVMNGLICLLQRTYPIALNNVNADGHTVLDSLMVSILRSHTSLTPAEVSQSFIGSTRFPGEEKDICGRWDADSPELRQLYKEGHPKIPRQWKHDFCHSSVQAVCHSMLSIFVPTSAPDINTLSGLFRHRFTDCGLEMKLGPLHVLVVTAVHLAERGMDGETLFGAIACAVCLLCLGADANLSVELSIMQFLQPSEDHACEHRPISAAELAEQIPQATVQRWKTSCRSGWKCLSLILHRAAAGFPQQSELRQEQPVSLFDDRSDDETDIFDDDESTAAGHPCELPWEHEYLKIPCIQDLGILWASIQTELLTYRKVTSLDPSISENFRMDSLEKWLEGETDTFQTPLVEDGMMKEHAKCGWFYKEDGNFEWAAFVPQACQVSAHYFMNMDVWTRATFVHETFPLGYDEY